MGGRNGKFELAAWDVFQVDCVVEVELCREHQITGFPSIRVFRSGAQP